MTQAIEGTVRAVGGGFIAGAVVALSGVAPSAPARTVSDAGGHYMLPPAQVQSSHVWVSASGLNGYASGVYPVPLSSTPDRTVHVDVHVQRIVTLVDDVAFQLTNDDIDAMSDPDVSNAPPPDRWPVKFVQLAATVPGPLEIRAHWSGETPVSVWLEHRYLDDSLTSQPVPGESSAAVTVSDAWLQSRAGGGVIITVGVPFSNEGVSVPIDVRLTVRQANGPS